MDVNAVPTPPVSPRMNRASSEPPTPVSAGAKARKGRRASDAASDSSSDVETCAAITKAGKRCKNKVKTPAALDVIAPSPGAPVVRFCGVHQKEVVSSVSGFYSKKAGMTDQWVKFDVYIPENLQPDTKAALRVEMEKARSASDVEGYIYAFEIRDPDAPDVFHIKVGRAVNLTKRIDQWSKQCGSKEQTLRGWWPGLVDPSETSLLKGRVVAGEKGANCHRLERLIHIELADLVLHQPHYNTANDDSDEESKTKKSKKARLVTPRGPCADCGTVHKEIFSFQRPKGGKYVGKEWEKLVKPVIERWGEFVELYV
ncbi:hypothetical protein SCHPADRAFT_832220 [Schizopora paradoxa]|uniref:Bacteriophage T5 Orf172 DNA-binding domain-containing protein n=1 Tax=Schizopora paradoxa TaxID=27342 RepID=A0A0H2RGF9_9AGAM|nr:hypothetical protein SCHPADRAFT_832220 [Schizopora paradoxa]